MKKHLLKLSLYFIVLLLVNGSSCKKQCQCGNNYKKIPESTKEWFWFSNGSSWIYRLAEDPTVFDTITITRAGDQYSNKFCSNEFSPAIQCSEVLTIIYKHSNAKYFPKYNVDTLNGDLEISHIYSPHGGGQFISIDRNGNEGIIVGFPLNKGENYDRYTLVDTFSNYSLLGNDYSNVVYSAEVDNTGIPNGAMVWYAKNIGLLKIKSIFPKVSTWELVKYNH